MCRWIIYAHVDGDGGEMDVNGEVLLMFGREDDQLRVKIYSSTSRLASNLELWVNLVGRHVDLTSCFTITQQCTKATVVVDDEYGRGQGCIIGRISVKVGVPPYPQPQHGPSRRVSIRPRLG